MQEAFFTSLGTQVLRLSHYRFLSGHSGESHFYDELQCENYCLYKDNDAYTTVAYCPFGSAKGTTTTREKQLRLFLVIWPLRCGQWTS